MDMYQSFNWRKNIEGREYNVALPNGAPAKEAFDFLHECLNDILKISKENHEKLSDNAMKAAEQVKTVEGDVQDMSQKLEEVKPSQEANGN